MGVRRSQNFRVSGARDGAELRAIIARDNVTLVLLGPDGRPLDITTGEFELLRVFREQPSRVLRPGTMSR